MAMISNECAEYIASSLEDYVNIVDLRTLRQTEFVIIAEIDLNELTNKLYSWYNETVRQ